MSARSLSIMWSTVSTSRNWISAGAQTSLTVSPPAKARSGSGEKNAAISSSVRAVPCDRSILEVVVRLDHPAAGNVRDRHRVDVPEGIVATRPATAAEIDRAVDVQTGLRMGVSPADGRELTIKDRLFERGEGISFRM